LPGNERKITSLLFQQQLVASVYGVIRLYTDFVALYEDQKVKQETAALAEKLFSDTKAQVDEGTLAPVEMDARQRAGLLHAPGPDQCARAAPGGRGHPQERADQARE